MEIRTTRCKERDKNYTHFTRLRYFTIFLKGVYIFYRLIIAYRSFGQVFCLHLQVLRRTKRPETDTAQPVQVDKEISFGKLVSTYHWKRRHIPEDLSLIFSSCLKITSRCLNLRL
jgi:hypothetical protein